MRFPQVLEAFDKWLNPASNQRRRVSVFVVGYGYNVEKLVEALTRPCVTLTSGDVNVSKKSKRWSSRCELM